MINRFLTRLSLGLLLGLLVPMAANGQENHTYPPLPQGARVISEENGLRISVFNGVVWAEYSRERVAKRKPPTVEEAVEVLKTARPIRKVNESPSSSAPSRPQPKPGPPGRIPGVNFREKTNS
jgi:hypothetical protein